MEAQRKTCVLCGGLTYRDEITDAYFCGTCDDWAEKACDDPQCSYCTLRGARPSSPLTDDEKQKVQARIDRLLADGAEFSKVKT